MRHRYLHRGALAAAVLALALTNAAAADDFRGTWRGTWPNGQTTELTVVRLDDEGHAYGAYCHRSSRGTRHFLLDLHATKGVTASLDDEALRFENGGGNWAFRVDPADPDVVRMAFRRTKTNELDLKRSDEQTCASRLRQLNPPADAPRRPTVAELIPDDPDHWAIGAWTATRPAGLPIELALFDVDHNKGYGIYCNVREGPAYIVHDINPDALNAKVTRRQVSFRIGDVRFAFERTDDPDTVDAIRRDNRGKKTVQGHRADEAAVCTSKIVALPRE